MSEQSKAPDSTTHDTEDSARYSTKEADQSDDAARYSQGDAHQIVEKDEGDIPELAADLNAMVENINADLANLYQEINQHINEQLEQVKESRQDIHDLMGNLSQQLKNNQTK